MSDLNILLAELDNWLKGQGMEIELIVIGAFALHLHGITSRYTMDIDTLNVIQQPKVISKIIEIGEKYGLPDWLNAQAYGLIIPAGFYSRTITANLCSNIILKYASRMDLIKLKIAAYFYRHGYELKDLDDLKQLKVSHAEFAAGIDFLLEYHSPEEGKFKRIFFQQVDLMRIQLKKVLFE